MRDVMRQSEESYDWLCCLADNAIIAAESEDMIKTLSDLLDGERNRAVTSLQNAMETYTQQHNSILEAISIFSQKIHTHASDYLKREQLISKAFLHYLMGIISGEIRPHTSEIRRSSVAWEGKFISDRSNRKEQSLNKDFNISIQPFDKLCADIKERLHVQLQSVMMRMQAILNGRDNEVNKRKTQIQQRFGKHVNKSCNSRRLRLKNSMTARKDEYDLESKCITQLGDVSASLRVAIEDIWVKQHLRERRMVEAVTGRMERLEKSALIIWNKHSHLANGEEEAYKDWIDMYHKNKTVAEQERFELMGQTNDKWREPFVKKIKVLADSTAKPIRNLVKRTCSFDYEVSIDVNQQDLRENTLQLSNNILTWIRNLRSIVKDYTADERVRYSEASKNRSVALVLEWQDNLFRLNNSINRRVGTLKDMECDLEETIRLTMVQHEAEASIFEQQSCAKLEQFWVDWRLKVETMGSKLRDQLKDYNIALATGTTLSGARNPNDIDDLVAYSKPEFDGKGDGKSKKSMKEGGKPPMGTTEEVVQAANNAQTFKEAQLAAAFEAKQVHKLKSDLTDTQRIKKVLDEIRFEIYKEFNARVLKGLETLRREKGDGRKRYLPAWMVCQVLFNCIDWFYDRGRLAERCVGTLSCRGKMMYVDGLPIFARSYFVTGTYLSLISDVCLRGKKHLIDIDDIMQTMESKGIKRSFLVGLLLVTQELGSLGQKFIMSEAVCACSNALIVAPEEVQEGAQVKKILKGKGGFYKEDPSDIVNSIIGLRDEVYVAPTSRHNTKEGMSAPSSPTKSMPSSPSKPTRSDNDEKEEEVDHSKRRTEPNLQIFDLTELIPTDALAKRIAPVMTKNDMTVLVSLLGRPGHQVEMTPYRFTQALCVWRKTALAILIALLDPPGYEYARMSDMLLENTATRTVNKKLGYVAISCMSPYASVSSIVDWLTSLQGIPLTVQQALCIMTRSGSVDPWLEDPNQTTRDQRLVYEVTELVESYSYKDSLGTELFVNADLQKNITEIVKSFNVNDSGIMPLEMLRSYIYKHDQELTHAQMTTIFWAICRTRAQQFDEDNKKLDWIDKNVPREATKGVMVGGREIVIEQSSTAATISSSTSKVAPNAFNTRPRIATQFNGDPQKYMEDFDVDVRAFLNSMPSLDANAVTGQPELELTPNACNEVITHAVILDPSAKNPTPQSSVIWLGSRSTPLEEALSVTCEKNEDDGMLMLGGLPPKVTPGTPLLDTTPLLELRLAVETDILLRYPLACLQVSADTHFSSAGGEAITQAAHWAELMTRRLGRTDRLTINWRDIMFNEWAQSLYESRRSRYNERETIVRNSINIYHDQYDELKITIVEERRNLLSLYHVLEKDLGTLANDEIDFLHYHTTFLERVFVSLEQQIQDSTIILRDTLAKYLGHSGLIKRRALERVAMARDRLNHEMELSCSGLILGYTGGYAQGFFDELLYQGELLRKGLTMMHGSLISQKEKFVYAKEEIEGDLTVQVSDRITIDRNRTKGVLDALAADSAQIQEALSVTRAGYASIQKDANARLVVRIEKAVREARKLRTAAEQNPELEKPVLAEIRVVLDSAWTMCMSIVKKIRDTSIEHLKTIEPMRFPHKEKMLARIEAVKTGWNDCETVIHPLLKSFEREIFTQLDNLKIDVTIEIEDFTDSETKKLTKECTFQRKNLIASFRKHFTEYDLSEGTIFERYNAEVQDTLKELETTWGPAKPIYFTNAIVDVTRITNNFLHSHMEHVHCSVFEDSTKRSDSKVAEYSNDDSTIYHRMQIIDLCSHTLLDMVDAVKVLPDRYVEEKADQLEIVEELGLNNNGDMIRPQISAVVDLLLSGVEIETDFCGGYDSLKNASADKSKESFEELNDFIVRISDPTKVTSVGASAATILERIEKRRDEVNNLLEASHAHIVADHSRMNVLMTGAEKDIEEWTSLTTQLIENAFKNAEESFLSNLWPTPPSTPRLEEIPEDEDRVGKIKALLGATQEPIDLNTNLTKAKRDKKKPIGDPSKDKKQKKVKEGFDEVIQLQGGWTECYTPEGFTYFFNPETGESLWDLPTVLKVPVHKASYFDNMEIETPRGLISNNMDGEVELEPVTIDFVTDMVNDPKVILTIVTEEARSFALGAIESVMEITKVMKGQVKHGIRNTRAERGGGGLDPLVPPPAAGPRAVPLHNRSVTTPNTNVGLIEGVNNDGETALVTIEPNQVIQRDFEEQFGGDEGQYDDDAEDSEYADSKIGNRNNTKRLQEEEDYVDVTNLISETGSEIDFSKDKHLLNAALIPCTGRTHDNENLEQLEGIDEEGTALNEVMTEEKILAEEKFNEILELDLMGKESKLCVLENDQYDEIHCNILFIALEKSLNSVNIYAEDVRELRTFALQVRRLTVDALLTKNNTSWDDLNLRVFETLAAEEEARILKEKLYTNTGRDRHRAILEHAEDIDDMAMFIRSAGIGKVAARKAATEAVLQKLTTSKKMSKVWQRDKIDLKFLGLDNDDQEELELALKQIIFMDERNSPIKQQLKQQQTLPVQTTNSMPQTPVVNSFYLDPSLVNNNNTNNTYDNTINNASNNNMIVQEDSSNAWVEYYTEDGHLYYFNTITEESSWTQPEGYHPNTSYQYDSGGFYYEESQQNVVGYDQGNYANIQTPSNTSNGNFFNESYDDSYVDNVLEDPSYDDNGNVIQTIDDTYYEDPNFQSQSIVEENSYDSASAIQSQYAEHGEVDDDIIKPRIIPIPNYPDVVTHSKSEGIARQLILLNTQDRWQNALVKSQFYSTEQKALYLKSKEALYKKTSERVEARLTVFVDDIKYMQRAIKKELLDLNTSEAELRKLFDSNNENSIRAESLSFVLEGLEKLKSQANTRFEGAYKQLEKFLNDWMLIRTELTQVGDIYDETVLTNLEQCRMNSEHNSKVFQYDQNKIVKECQVSELGLLRKSLRHILQTDDKEKSWDRHVLRKEQLEYYKTRESNRRRLMIFYHGYEENVEDDLTHMGLQPIQPEVDVPLEEDVVMSFMIRHVEMKAALNSDYDSVLDATTNITEEMLSGTYEFDNQEKQSIEIDGSWFDKHRETIERHTNALTVTLQKVKEKVNAGFQDLNAKIEALDFDVERAAEEELAEIDPDTIDTHGYNDRDNVVGDMDDPDGVANGWLKN
jgi:hypothetical protein